MRSAIAGIILMGCVTGCAVPTRLASPALLADMERSKGPESMERSGNGLAALGQRTSAARRWLGVLLKGTPSAQSRAVAKLTSESGFALFGKEMERLSDGLLPKLAAQQMGQLNLLLGVYLMRTGRLDGSMKRLKAVDRADAQYLYGVILLGRGERGAARDVFLRVLQLAKGKKAHTAVGELATLAMARLSHEEKKTESARRYYLSIPLASPHFYKARQELAWVELAAGRFVDTLTQTALLMSPHFARYAANDREILQSAALLGLCRYADAKAVARGAKEKLNKVVKEVANFLRIRPDMRLYYVEATAAMVGVGSELRSKIWQTLLADAGFRRAFKLVDQIQRERRLLRDDPALRRLLMAELDERLIQAQKQAGRTVYRLLVAQLEELRQLRQRSEEILFELEQPKGRQSAPKEQTAGKGEQKQRWRYEGELWSDEVSAFRLSLSSSCSSADSR
jgi:hypothetical protein